MEDGKVAEVLMPAVDDTATVSYWYFEEGDPVEEGDDLVAVQLTNGASLKLVAPRTGILNEVLYVEGDEVEEGDVLALVEDE